MAETTTSAGTVTSEWVEEFVERWLAAWNSHQPERVLDLMTDDIIFDDSAKSQTMRGHAQVREFLEFCWRAFPDFTVEAVGGPLVASDGARAAFWWRCRMTNTGPVDPPGIPATGKLVEYEGADFHEYGNGKVARLRILYNMADILRQMGLLPERDSVE
ncbi:MAG: ester cyclase [Candidatus Binatia bacterium]